MDHSFYYDIPLTITVELGRTSMRVRELLGLTVGSVVELDQPAGSAVDILGNGFRADVFDFDVACDDAAVGSPSEIVGDGTSDWALSAGVGLVMNSSILAPVSRDMLLTTAPAA